jgi:hypothetical protein
MYNTNINGVVEKLNYTYQSKKPQKFTEHLRESELLFVYLCDNLSQFYRCDMMV